MPTVVYPGERAGSLVGTNTIRQRGEACWLKCDGIHLVRNVEEMAPVEDDGLDGLDGLKGLDGLNGLIGLIGAFCTPSSRDSAVIWCDEHLLLIGDTVSLCESEGHSACINWHVYIINKPSPVPVQTRPLNAVIL